jgi:hypothetical protein
MFTFRPSILPGVSRDNHFMSMFDELMAFARSTTSSLKGKRVAPSAAARAVRAIIARGDGRGHINTDRLVILNMGLGRDSMAMLALLAEGKLRAEGHQVRPQDIDAIVFSDPGMEWDHTYQAVADVDRVLDKIARKTGVRVPFYALKKPPKAAWDAYLKTVADVWATGARGGSHEPHRLWRRALGETSIQEKAAGGYYHLRAPIDSDYARGRPHPFAIDFGETACTDNHKVQVIRRLMLDLGKQKFGDSYTSSRWKSLVMAGERAPHVNLLGIAAGEGSEASGPRALYMHPYDAHHDLQLAELKQRVEQREARGRGVKALNKKIRALERGGPLYVTEAYPLVELGISKDDEGPILARHGLGHIKKSGCVFCHSQPPEWYWLLWEKARRGDRWAKTSLDRIVEYERASMGYRNAKTGERGKAIFRGSPWQTKEPGVRRSPQLRGDARRSLLEVIDLIRARLIDPRVARYQAQGLSRRRATDKVMEQVLRKDYAQGCEMGSVNRMQAWSKLCWKHATY